MQRSSREHHCWGECSFSHGEKGLADGMSFFKRSTFLFTLVWFVLGWEVDYLGFLYIFCPYVLLCENLLVSLHNIQINLKAPCFSHERDIWGQNSHLALTIIHFPVGTAAVDVSETLLSKEPACMCLKVVDSVAFTRKWMLKSFFFFFLIGLASSENYPFLSQLKEDYKQKMLFLDWFISNITRLFSKKVMFFCLDCRFSYK